MDDVALAWHGCVLTGLPAPLTGGAWAARRKKRRRAARPRGLEPLGHDGAAARTRTTRPRRCGREDSNARLRAAAGTRTLDCALQRGLERSTARCSGDSAEARRHAQQRPWRHGARVQTVTPRTGEERRCFRRGSTERLTERSSA